MTPLAALPLAATLAPATTADASPNLPATRLPGHAHIALRTAADVSNQVRPRVRVGVAARRKLPRGWFIVREGRHVLAATRTDVVRRRVHATLALPRLRAGEHRIYVVFRSHGRTLARSAVTPVASHVGCAWRPRSCGFPDAASTGPRRGVRLRSVPGQVRSGPGWHFDPRGWIEVDGNGAVLAGITSRYGVDITANRVTIRDSRLVVSGESMGVAIRHSSVVTIDHVAITAPAASGPQRLMVGVKDVYGDASGVRVSHCDISRTSTGVQMDAGVIRDNYIHDMGYNDGDHINGTTANGGSRPLVITHNTVFNQISQTDAVSLFQDFGPQENRTITDNLLGGGGYALYAGANSGKESSARNIVVAGNRFASLYFRWSGSYGPVAAYVGGNGNVWRSNVWDTTGRGIRNPDA